MREDSSSSTAAGLVSVASENLGVALATANGHQASEWASDDERRRKVEHGDVGTPHSYGASGTVLGVSVNELGLFPWRLWAWRLVDSAIRLLDGQSAHRPGGRDPGTGDQLRRSARSDNQTQPAVALYSWPEDTHRYLPSQSTLNKVPAGCVNLGWGCHLVTW